MPSRAAIAASLILLASSVPASAWAQAGGFSKPPPDAACTAKSARAADPAKVAADPDAFLGRCVRLKGLWRDIGFYPSLAEAAQPDALSIATLSHRRIGLYLSDADDKAAPTTPKPAVAVGTVGDCSKGFGDRIEGYCRYMKGAYLAVSEIAPAK